MTTMVCENKKDYPEGLTVGRLIALENADSPVYVTVMVNDSYIATEDRETRALQDGDTVEFLVFMGGGG